MSTGREPPMDFFAQQDRARRNTWLLLALLVPAGAVVAAGVALALAAVWACLVLWGEHHHVSSGWVARIPLFHPAVVAWGTALVMGLMALASARKVSELAFAGPRLAALVGGRKIRPETTDSDERKLCNVVEEMALAAGMPVPDLFVLDNEPGVNAFCAGNAPVRVGDTVLAVTRGCLVHLERDELQAVVAHEFSHMLSGDMRLNVRLIGLLHGIDGLGQAGGGLLRLAWVGKAAPFLVLLGLAAGSLFLAAGGVGLFLGKLVRASVCRQREALADAAAVQFTRNPAALASVLKKIAQAPGSSVLRHRNAAVLSHMYFSRGVAVWWKFLFSTHPPLAERIRLADPSWKGPTPVADRTPLDRILEMEERRAASRDLPGRDVNPPDTLGEQIRLACESAGRPRQAHLNRARSILDALPRKMQAAARQAQPARAVVLALLLSPDPATRQSQLAGLEARGDKALRRLAEDLAAETDKLKPESRIPLLDLSAPALKGLAASQYRDFRETVQRLAMADGRLEVHEWMLAKMLLRHLDPHFGLARSGGRPPRTLRSLRREGAAVLSSLAWAGSRTLDEARAAFDRGAPHLGLRGLSLEGREECGLARLEKVLAALESLPYADRRKVLDACAAAVAADARITVREAELVHGVADALGCPMPLLIPS
ncbi:MAG: M48 family metalloprotease [Thermodesulfobacteriota bacterium]